MSKRKTTYGWLALIVALLCSLVFNGFVGNTSGLLLGPMTEDIGISRTLFSTLQSLTGIVNCLISLLFVKFADKLGLKLMATIGAGFAAGYCVLMMLAGNVGPGAGAVLIGLACTFMGINYSWATTMTASILINNWFSKNRGTMMSIFAVFSGLGGTIAAPIVQNWVLASGWQSSLLYRAIMCAALVVLFASMLRVKPGKNDCMIWEGQEEKDTNLTSAPVEVEEGLSFAEAKKTSNFWFCILTIFGIGCFLFPPITLIAAYATDCGYAEAAGFLISIIFIVNIIVTLPMGGLIDKFGNRKVLIPIFMLMAMSMLLLSIKNVSLPVMYIGAGLLGFGYATFQVPIPLITREVFGNKAFAQIQSYFYAAMIAGMSVGSIIFNAVYDAIGSYRTAFIVNAVIIVALIFVIIGATKRITAKVNE